MDEVRNLVEKVRKGDEESFASMLRIFHRMIYKIINSYNLEKGDYMIDPLDLYQEGCIALYEAIFSYEDNHNARFSSYAYMKIRSKIANYMRVYIRRNKEETYCLDRFIDVAGVVQINDKPLSYHREEAFKEQFDKFVEDLNPLDRGILKLRSESYSYREIATLLKTNTKLVDNRLQKMRKRLRAIMDKEK